MNVVIEDDSKKKKKLRIFYIGILITCILAVVLTIVLQVKGNDTIVGDTTKLPQVADAQKSQYKEKFESIFDNKVNYLENNSYKISRIDNNNKEIIYIGYKNQDNKINDYELDVNIPYINIDNSIIEDFNTQIKDIFEKKAKSIINTQNNNVIYTVNYSAYVSNNILSLVIRSTLKEGMNPQRDIIQTYNYDLTNQKEYTIDEILTAKGITKKEANQKIKDEIKEQQEKADELAKLGYTTYKRDYTSDMYSINNVTEYFLGEDNALYIIYAYGNENNTNEMDVVIM